MRAPTRSLIIAGPCLAVLALTVGACTSPNPASTGEAEQSAAIDEAIAITADEECSYPMTVTDMSGNKVEVASADTVVVTDNRAFGILNAWGVKPAAAPRTLMSPMNTWAGDESIADLGSHTEPDFEQVIAVDPTLVVNGYRYGDHAEKIRAASPSAALIDMDNPDLSAQEYTRQQVVLLGDLFCRQAEAQELLEQFDEAVDAAREAYDPAMTVMGLITSANEIRYANPQDGRGASIFFELLDLTPALTAEGSANHQGDDISIEAIAQSDADFFIVLDRDAAVSTDGDTTPALELIEGSAALANVPAVQNGAIYIMPADYYLTEDIYAYIDVLNGLRAAFAEQHE